MDWPKLIYELLGGLAIFFYGMQVLSSGLQAMSSTLIRKIINSLTTNRVVAVIVGLVVTCIVQSSSITTVMVVGFVNAGLMQLTQAVGVILGANVGTTITGWIISIKVGKYAYVFLALGILPIIAAKNPTISGWGKVLFALGMVFMGLQIMSGAFKPLRSNDAFLELMTFFAADTYLSTLATIGIGCLLTFAIQSSSAMLGITIALASTGSITFQTALALVMGENIGTTITALLAGLGSNINGKRAALAHALFNCFGVIVLFLIFPLYVKFIEWMVTNPADAVDAEGAKPYISVHIAAGHTVFNVINVCLFLPFVGLFSKLVTKILPSSKKQTKHLEYLGTALTLSPELAIVQAEKALFKMGDMVEKMMGWTRTYVCVDPKEKLKKDILKYETITDKIHEEVMLFVAHLMQANLNADEAARVNRILTISDELESLADYCQKIVSQVRHDELTEEKFSRDKLAMLDELMRLSVEYYSSILRLLKSDRTDFSTQPLEELRQDFSVKARQLRESQLDAVRANKANPLTTLTVHDISGCLGRVISHSRKVMEARLGRHVTYVE